MFKEPPDEYIIALMTEGIITKEEFEEHYPEIAKELSKDKEGNYE